VAPHAPRIHLRLEEARGPLDERVEGDGHPRRRRRSEAGRLAQQPEELGAPAASRKTERTTASMRSKPSPPLKGRLHGSASSPALRSMTAWSTASLLGNQYKMVCLRTRARRQARRVRWPRTAAAELHQGGVEDALGVSTATATMLDRFAYQMVDRADGHPGLPGRQADLHHRSTGFLGTALVERLLRTVPDVQLVLLVRPGRRASPTQRTAREILKNDCFDRLRAELGIASTPR